MSRTALVTGASRGIGRAIAARLIAEGCTVLNLDIRPPEDDDGTRFVAADLTDLAALRQVLADLTGAHEVTLLVNNAAAAVALGVEETTPETLERIMRINVEAPLLCLQAVLPAMKRQGFGRIVNIASRAALGKELRSAYAASKGGLISMTRVWALELAGHGITVNAIGPGPIATELFTQVNPPDSPRTREIMRSVPVGRIGRPDDVAQAALFFLGEDCGFVTGQTLYVCGGLTIGSAPN